MKNLISVFGLFIILFSLTGAKVIYKNDSGEIVAIGDLVSAKPDTGQSVIDVPGAKPEQLKTHIVKNDVYREKNSTEKQADTDKITTEKTNRKNLKIAYATKQKIDASDIPGLLAIIEDRNLD
jgi:hypothetical protein